MIFPSRALRCALLASGALCALPAAARAADNDDTDPRTVSGVVVTSQAEAHADRPLSARTLTAGQIAATTNVTTAEDALKYLPAIFVRRRHIGDTQAPISTRTSGVGASARSLIYVDGVLISALIGNNNSTASPRWGIVSPDEISRVDVLYGPFSAAYAGNSIGAVVNIETRSPRAFEMSAKVSAGVQAFKQYATRDDEPVYAASAAMGDRRGAFAWRLSANHLETRSQPLSYVTAARSATTLAGATPVSGAFADLSRAGAAIQVLGAGGLERQHQDNAKLRLEWTPTPTFGATYLLGFFGNRTDAHVESYLRDGSGATVYAGALAIGGATYASPATTFANGMYHLEERHWIQALSLKGEATPHLRWDATGTLYDYGHDQQRTPSVAPPTALTGGAGSILDLSGTGWRTFDAHAVWTPEGPLAAHAITLGLHNDRYVLGSDRYNTTDWIAGARGALAAASRGKTETEAAFVQDALRLTPELGLTVGLRAEHWRAFDGLSYSLAPTLSVNQPRLSADRASPKAVLAWTPDAQWRVTASAGAAWRFPTVGELYQAVTVGTSLQSPNPNLRPEHAVSSELSIERAWTRGRLRLSAFTEDINDALISQTGAVTPGSTTLVAFVQNVDKVRSRGLEAALEAHDVLIRGLDLQASADYVDSTTVRDAGFPAAVGKRTPQLPRWRATAVATWRASERLTLSTAARYSDRPYGTLDNADPVGHTYQGFEGYFVVDARASYRIDGHWTAALGVDNLNNNKYFVFHSFPQRSVLAELRFDY